MKIAGVFPDTTHLDPKLDPDPEEPLGIEYVLGSAAAAGFEVQLFIPFEETFEELLKRICEFRPDVLALSLYTMHVPLGIAIAKALKLINSEIIVVVGGPHSSAEPQIVLEDVFDFCVIGEGEITFVHLLNTIVKGGDPRNIPGVAFKERGGNLFIATPRERIQDLDSLPYPLRYRDCYNKEGYSIYYPPNPELRCASVLFSRGCSYQCSFCSSPSLWQRKVVWRSVESMIRELHYLMHRYDVNFVFFEDLTFCLDANKVRKLCEQMLEKNIGIHWWCQTTTKRVNGGDLLKLMRDAGCSKIGWGIESTSEETLRRLKKLNSHNPPNVSETKEVLETAASMGILNLGYVMLGFPWETKESILSLADNITNYEIHQIRLAIATPYPGSEWYSSMEKSSFISGLETFDTSHLVYCHPTISPNEMKILQWEIFKKFYSSPKYQRRMLNMIKKFPHLKQSFEDFWAYIETYLHSNGAISPYDRSLKERSRKI